MAITFNHNDKLYVSGSNVGIGTDSPSSILHLENAGNTWAKFINTSGTNQRLDVGTNSSSQHFVFGYGDYPVLFGSNGAERMRITSGGDVGIGTTAPSKTLSVETTDTATYDPAVNASEISVARKNTSNTAGQVAAISLNATGWSGSTTGVVVLNAIQRQGNYSNADFAIQNRVGGNFVETFRITTYGDVGIGTDSPDGILDVTDDNTQMLYTSASSDRPWLQLKHNAVPADGDEIGLLDFRGYNDASQDTRYVILTAKAEDVTDGSEDGSLTFQTMTDGTATQTLTMRSGKVGIGTTSPANILDIDDGAVSDVRLRGNQTTDARLGAYNFYNTAASDTVAAISADRDGADDAGALAFDTQVAGGGMTERMRITSTGNVGIGITGPLQKLDVSGVAYFRGGTAADFGSGNTPTDTALVIDEGDFIYTKDHTYLRRLIGKTTGDIIQIGESGTSLIDGIELKPGSGGSGRYIAFFDNNTESARFTGGNLGIGTTSPSAKLHVVGDAILGEHRIIDLPSFNMGGSSVTDEYLVVCKQAPSGGGVDASGIQGRISFSRGSSASFNNSQYIDINIQMSLDSGNVNNVDVTQFELYRDSSNPFFSQLEEIDINGTKYVALKARTSGGGDVNHFYFEGSISDASDTNILSRVRASDSTVTVTDPQPTGFPITPYITKNQDGNVGIGTTDPSVNLEVAGAVKVTDSASGVTIGGVGHASLRLNRASTSYDNNILFNTNGDTKFRIWQDGNADYLYIRDDDNATNMVTFKKGGNVGIGTTDPSRDLHIVKSNDGGQVRFQIINTSNTADSTSVISIYNGGANGGDPFLHWKIDVQQDWSMGIDNSDGDKLKISKNFGPGTNDYLTVDTSGNVGIGTTSPTRKLHVSAGATVPAVFDSTQDYTLGLARSGTEEWWLKTYTDGRFAIHENGVGDKVTIKAGGNVGIGTTDPNQLLHTVGGTVKVESDGSNASGAILELKHANNNSTDVCATINFTNNVGGYAAIEGGTTGANNTGYLAFKTDNAGTQGEAVRILGNGNVGIGTTGPSYPLEVNGSIQADKLYIGGNFADEAGINIGTSQDLTFVHSTYQNDYKTRFENVDAGGGVCYLDWQVWSNTYNSWNSAIRVLSTDSSATHQSVKISNAFTLPNSDGSSGQVMTTNGSGTLSWSNVTTSDTLDDVTDNGNSTTNSIVLGASTTGGTMLVRGTYTSGNIVVIGGMKSSGGAMIGYGVKPDTATNHGFVSSSAFTLERSAYYQQGNRHRWYAGASQDVAIGNAVTMSETMRLDFDKLGLSNSSPASLIHLGKPTNGSNIITFGEAGIGGPHGLDFYGDDATRTLKYSIYYRTGTENISMETSDGTKRFEINQSGAVTLNEAFTFPTADGSAGAALVTNGSGSLSWNAGYQQYTPVGWGILNNQTYTSTGSNISSNSVQAQAGTTPVQRNSATEFEATKAGWYEISYSFIVKNNYTNRAMIGAYMTASTSGGGGVISGSHSTQYVRYSTYGEYAQIQNTFYYYTSASSTNFYLLAYLLSGSMNMTTQAISQSMISFRYINNDIT